jgi:hypothetical protein
MFRHIQCQFYGYLVLCYELNFSSRLLPLLAYGFGHFGCLKKTVIYKRFYAHEMF